MRDIMKKKQLNFEIPKFLDKDIDILIAANNSTNLTVDCELDNLYGSINMCQYGNCITKEQADELREYYLKGGWLYADD